MEGFNDLHATNDDLNTVLIKAGSIAMIAQMAGVNHLYFGEMNTLNQLNHYTSLLNIQNIMRLESKVMEIKDPLEGAYAIEHLTNELLDQLEA